MESDYNERQVGIRLRVRWCPSVRIEGAGAYPGFCSMKWLGVFLLPVDGMLVQRRVTPSSNVACSHLFSWVERGTGRVKCLLSQEHNTVFRVRARTRTARSRDEGTVLTVFNFESIQNYVSHSKSICFVSCKRTTLNHLSIWMVCQLYKKLRFFINSHKL